jgi:hypothetical protein
MRLILAALIAVVSCTSSPTDPVQQAAADGFNVRFGQTVTVAGTRISFTEINDSRCPKDVACVWAGDAAVTLQSGSERVVLHTNAQAGSTSGTLGGVTVTLADVRPEPAGLNPPPKTEYVATIRLSE